MPRTRELDGETWRQWRTPNKPAARVVDAIAYDPQARATVIHGSDTNSLRDTWQLRFVADGETDGACGTHDEDGDRLTDCQDVDCLYRGCDALADPPV